MICLIWMPDDAETVLYFYCENRFFRNETRWKTDFEYCDNESSWFPRVNGEYYRGMYV